ncbi:RNA recognition motif-containing protein RRM, partial [Reticulomyxa filosa]
DNDNDNDNNNNNDNDNANVNVNGNELDALATTTTTVTTTPPVVLSSSSSLSTLAMPLAIVTPNTNTAKVITLTHGNETGGQSPWTLRYRTYLGNTRFMLILFLLYFLAFLGVVAVLYIFIGYDDINMLAVTYVMSVGIGILACGSKINGCRDLFEIQSFVFFFFFFNKTNQIK